MAYSPHNTQQRLNKPPDPILTGSLSKTSLNSSTLSLSPSASVLLSSSSRPSRNESRSSKTPISSQQSTHSLSNTKNTKLEQIIQNFYTKTAQIIIQSRVSSEGLKYAASGEKRKLNKWFNIATHDCENLREELKFWKSFVKNGQEEQAPPLIIDIYLETTEPELLQEGDDARGWNKLNLGVQRILIESWTLSLNHPLPDFPVDLPNLYKRSIVFFRSLHSLVRLLPSHNLNRRLKVHDGEISLGYRLSAMNSNQYDEVPIDRPLSPVDTINFYEFKEVVTPLGTFKLKLLYRNHCQFVTRENTSTSLPGVIDVDENYFTPTMTKYRQEYIKEAPYSAARPSNVTIYPSSSTSSSTSRSRLNSYRLSTNRYPTASNSNTTNLERRISAPLVQPFKSPSLSSSPQAEIMLTPSRSQTPERPRPESGSFSRKIEFSSSFEKFKSANSSNNSSNHNISRTSLSHIATPDTVRRRSRTGDHSGTNLDLEEDEGNLEDFMKFINVRQELKLFQQQQSVAQLPPSQQQEHEEAKRSLSHYRNIQEAHNILSDSMSFSIHPSLANAETSFSYESSSSSINKGLNLPSIPSPLHNTKPGANSSTSQPLALQLTAHQAEIVAQSPLKNRQAPPPPPPPLAPVRRISGSRGLVDDDDSLVFKMSELSAGYEDEEDHSHKTNKLGSHSLRRVGSSGNLSKDSKNDGPMWSL